ncbi:hypothetical protein F8388_008499 [Cannabis sativa]|uniref:Uncharacterized protein n=1 Tax=Cannabis sativa TaxID=3483 RepID=A0A7J6EHZ2_CANSA|nr:hypothetical protein F8388_008499 [Cannabis sativa]
MASLQCSRPTHETCQQKCHNGSSSLGQKMSGMASWVKGGNTNTHHQSPKPMPTTYQNYQAHHVATCKTKTQCHCSQAQAHTQTNYGYGSAKPQKAHYGHGHDHSNHGSSGHSTTKHHTTNAVTSCHCVTKTNCRHSQSVMSHSQGHNHNYIQYGTGAAGGGTIHQKKEGNLFRRIKNRISGNSSSSDSSSDSDNDNNECCRQRKK